MENYIYIYLHGFASSPKSNKAVYLRDRFAEININLKVFDLNQDNFTQLTLTRQLHQVESEIKNKSQPIILIGSSFGGLTSTFLAERKLNIQGLILLAPAFEFLSHWLPKLGDEKLKKWQEDGYLSVYHYGVNDYLPLSYNFLVDAAQYESEKLQRALPTLIFHGLNDDVIPIQASRDFAAIRPWVKLIEVYSDHTLGNVMPEVWQQIYDFLKKDFNL